MTSGAPHVSLFSLSLRGHRGLTSGLCFQFSISNNKAVGRYYARVLEEIDSFYHNATTIRGANYPLESAERVSLSKNESEMLR